MVRRVAYLDRIAECNQPDLRRYIPWEVGTARVGWVRSDRLTLLEDTPIQRHQKVLRLAKDDVAPAERTRQMEQVVEVLAARGAFRSRVAERYPVKTDWHDSALLELERSAVSFFGVHAYGVHVNGYVRTAQGLEMWIARRARAKSTYPGMLDNMVAGGQPVGLGLRENLAKECAEEAGIPPELAATARSTGAVTYCIETEQGLKPDAMFCFDLELPADFVPECQDGEVDEFYRWPVDRVLTLVRDTREFKFNCNLVVIDFAMRHGLLDVEAADYLAIARGLRRGAP
ncbi:MAG: DUF4743 domain-containing protein [Planctomycetota bacterium]